MLQKFSFIVPAKQKFLPIDLPNGRCSRFIYDLPIELGSIRKYEADDGGPGSVQVTAIENKGNGLNQVTVRFEGFSAVYPVVRLQLRA